VLASEELATLFKPEGHQSDMMDYFIDGSAEAEVETVLVQPTFVKTPGIAEVSLSTTEEIESDHNQNKKKKARVAEQFQTTLF